MWLINNHFKYFLLFSFIFCNNLPVTDCISVHVIYLRCDLLLGELKFCIEVVNFASILGWSPLMVSMCCWWSARLNGAVYIIFLNFSHSSLTKRSSSELFLWLSCINQWKASSNPWTFSEGALLVFHIIV